MNEKKASKNISEETLNNSLVSFERNSNTKENLKFANCRTKGYSLVSELDPDNLFSYFRTFCKSYTCPYCGPRKAVLMKHLIMAAMEKFGLKVFLTLTLDPKSCSAEESARYIKRVWNKFRTIQKRHFKRGLNYIHVLEFQKSGYAHLHVLIDSYVDWEWLKQAWASVGGGTIVDAKKADLGTAKYLSKYLCKTLTRFAGQKFRLISTSRGIKLSGLLEKKSAKFSFQKIEMLEARKILKNRIESDIKNRRDEVIGFKSTRRLHVENV